MNKQQKEYKSVIRFIHNGKRYQTVVTEKRVAEIEEWFKAWGLEMPTEGQIINLKKEEPGLWTLMLKVWGFDIEIMDAKEQW